MNYTTNPGSPNLYINLAGSSRDHLAHGGSDLPPPEVINRREQVKATDHPSTDRWVVLRTVRLPPTPLFWVGVVDGFNSPTVSPTTHTTLPAARRAANRLYARHIEEN